MPSCPHIAALLSAVLFISGCAHAPSERRTSKKTAAQKDSAEEDRSTEAIERRTEAHARYAAGVVLDLKDNAEAAVEEYYKAALADVRDEQLVMEVTRRLLQLRQHDKALELLQKATDHPRSSGQLHARLGMVYSLAGRKEEAIEANRVAIRKAPHNLSGYQNLVHIHLQAREPEAAMKVLEAAAKQTNAEPIVYVELADLYALIMRGGGGDVAKARALEMLARADELNPTNPLLQQKLADGLAALGETERAAALYLKLLEKYPNLPSLREKLIEIYIRTKDKKKAIEQLEAVVRNNPTSAQAYYMLGSLAYEEKNFKQAIEHFNKALLLTPNFEQLYYDLAGAQVNSNEPRDALQTLERARGKFPPSFVNEYYTAMAYSRLKDHTNALKHLVAAEVVARATDTNRLTQGFYFQLGAAYERTQAYAEAEKYFRRCLRVDPKFSEAMNYLGYMWAELGTNLVEARELIEKAVEIEPQNAAYLDSLGWVLFKLDRAEEALVWLKKAIEHAEEPDATLYDHLGDVYVSLDKLPEAREAWRKAVSIEPNSKIEEKIVRHSDGTARPATRK